MQRTDEFRINYEGPGEGGEYFGNTTANFTLWWPYRSGREISVNVNAPALEYLAGLLGLPLEKDGNADLIARRVGEIMLRRYEDPSGHIEPYLTVSRAMLARNPEIVNELRTMPWQTAAAAAAG